MTEKSVFEKEYVHKFYDEKAKEFSGTRYKPWPAVIDFVERYVKKDHFILDNGCGNGRCISSKNTIGLDYSRSLLKEVKQENLGLVRGDITLLPFKDKSFDIIFSVGVIHHLRTHESRLRSLKEAVRVLKDEGKIYLSIWSRDVAEQKKFSKVEGGLPNEFFASWRGDESIRRYYYLFDDQELKEICIEAGFEILEKRVDQESLTCILQKAQTNK